MKKTTLSFLTLFIFTPCLLWAQANHHQHDHEIKPEVVSTFLKNIFDDNALHLSNVKDSHYMSFSEKQSPRATVVTCSDSRVQTTSFHKGPANDLFFVRNIGNQIATNLGSVQYGVYHLHTPILLIIGHSNCGAIQAALGDYSQELAPIVQELDALHLKKSQTDYEGVIENVHNQVKFALDKFKDLMDKKALTVVGAVYDFSDHYGQGKGQLILIDLNGETDPAKIKESPFVKGIESIATKPKQ